MRVTLSIVVIVLIGISVYSEPPTNRRTLDQSPAALTVDNTTYINVNNILMFVTNHGNFGRDLAGVFGNDGGTYFPYISNQSITDGTMDDRVLYAAGIWAGGVDAVTRDTLVVVSEYSSEYVPGPMEGGTYLPDRPEFKVYKLYSDSLAANPNADYLNWPVDQGAPVNDLGEPVMLGDQMLWTVYNDADPSRHTNNNAQTAPLGIEIQQTTWAFDSSTEPLASTIFIKYKIYNRGYRTLEDFYLSVWFDPDLGGAGDDMVGCDTINQTMFCYNGDNDDTDYGSSPPAFGYKVMYGPLVAMSGVDGYFDGNNLANHWNLPMTAFTKYINGTDPDNYQETYAYMKGLRAKEPGFPPYQYNGQTLTFMHSGDPIAGTGDLDFNPSDKRMMGSFGPLTFAPGDSQFVQIAVVAAEGSDRFNSLANLNYLMSQLGPEPHTPIAIRVPDDYETIQAAIDVAWPGDTVLVAPGTYTGNGNRDLDFGGKNIVVRSENGPEVTTINCEATFADPHRGFRFHNNETPNAVVDGFTITQGRASDTCGGAILIESGAAPTISNNVITNCRAEYGGAIYLEHSSATITGNTINSNRAEHGGAIACDSSDVLIVNNVITENIATEAATGLFFFKGRPEIRDNDISNNLMPWDYFGTGAAIYGWISDVIIVDNTLSGNWLGVDVVVEDAYPQRGGGVYLYAGNNILISGNEVTGNRGGGIVCTYTIGEVTIADNIVSGNSLLYMGSLYDGRLNSAGIEVTGPSWGSGVTISNNVCTFNGAYTGGGILCAADDVTISDCRLEDNRGGEGSGMYLKGDNITVSNCVIVNNIAVGGYGGGIAVVECDPTIENCTIVGNRAGTGRGTALLVRDGAPVLNNCIVTDHSFGTLIECQSTAAPVFSYSDIYNNAEGDWVGCIAGQFGVNGNFSADPFFCDPENGDYHLSVISPCASDNNSCQVHIGALGIDCDTYVCGDVDWDGVLTTADVERIKDFYFSPPSDWLFPVVAGDMDCDGVITIADIVILAGYYYGYGSPPCCAPPPKRIDLTGHDKNDGPPGE